MDFSEIINDVFNTMPQRFHSGTADPQFKAVLGFDINGREYTLTINGKECSTIAEKADAPDVVLTTGAEEWLGVVTNQVDPTNLFLAGKLSVDGDIEKLLAAFALFDDYQSDLVAAKDPNWIIDTLGENFSVNDDGVFMVEGLTCRELVDKFGSPLYVTSENQLRQNFRMMKNCLTKAYPENNVNVMWAIKSNTTFALRKILNQEGAGGDCFTPGEIYATFVTGADPERFVLNGSDRNEETFRMALEVGFRITLDHMDDLDMVQRAAESLNKTARCLIRVKPDLKSLANVPSTFVPGIPLSFEVLNYKFGVTYDEAVELAKAAESYPNMEIQGLHSHVGRDVHLPEHWYGYAFDLTEMAVRLRDDTGIVSSIIDLGGGFAEKRDPSAHDLTKLAAPFSEYADQTAAGVRDACKKSGLPFPELWIEPGRSLVGPTTVMISTVGNVKRTPGIMTWVHVDASCNLLPTVERHNGASYHLLLGENARATAEETVDVVGPNCSGDLIQPRRKLPKMKRGDLLVFLDVGAYNSVAANQFNSIPRPPCLLVNGRTVDVIIAGETINDVFARQSIPARLLT
jgi:diaminopimelate decarboxylase